jgi:hypothetical protein
MALVEDRRQSAHRLNRATSARHRARRSRPQATMDPGAQQRPGSRPLVVPASLPPAGPTHGIEQALAASRHAASAGYTGLWRKRARRPSADALIAVVEAMDRGLHTSGPSRPTPGGGELAGIACSRSAARGRHDRRRRRPHRRERLAATPVATSTPSDASASSRTADAMDVLACPGRIGHPDYQGGVRPLTA